MTESKKLTIRERWRKACTADNIVDFSVDVFLIVFDVLSSPILIVMRVIRWLLAKFVNEHVKNFIKRIVHWFMDNRKVVNNKTYCKTHSEEDICKNELT